MPILDRNLPIPLYHQLKQILFTSLENKEFVSKMPLPTEAVLMQQYSISRITVRRAMAELEQEGHIYRRPGKGTFVAEPKIRRGMTKLTSFSEDMKGKGLAPTSKLLVFQQEPASAHVAKKLDIEAGTSIYFVQRLRLDDQLPIAINFSYLRIPANITISVQELKEKGSLWALLESKGIVLADAERTIEAILASSQYAKQLQVEVGAPLLLVDGVVCDNAHVPVEYHQVINRGDRYQYSIRLKR